MSERHIELTWRCAACRHQNLGRHMACQNCGDPKDASEEYEMPTDTEKVASVEDPALLKMARAGEHWKCAYCGSHQRDLDGSCARCGAGRKDGANVRAPRAAVRRSVRWKPIAVVAGAAVLLFGTCLVMTKPSAPPPPTREPERLAVVAPPPRTDFPATVTAVTWTRTVTVESWQLVPHEGFTAELPASAVDAKPAGERFHHVEQVFDHDETVYDDVEVPDGYRTETYSEREACGQDCTPSTRSCRQVCTQRSPICHEVCTNKKNGFASCHQECSGGGQSCHDECTGSDGHCVTKYCDRTRTRQIPKTRTEKRPRIVKKYREEPRMARWSTYATWEWVTERTAEESGNMAELHWPDAGSLRAAAVLADGGLRAGTERAERSEQYRARLTYEDGTVRDYAPSSEDEARALALGSTVQTRVIDDRVTLLSLPPRPDAP